MPSPPKGRRRSARLDGGRTSGTGAVAPVRTGAASTAARAQAIATPAIGSTVGEGGRTSTRLAALETSPLTSKPEVSYGSPSRWLPPQVAMVAGSTGREGAVVSKPQRHGGRRGSVHREGTGPGGTLAWAAVRTPMKPPGKPLIESPSLQKWVERIRNASDGSPSRRLRLPAIVAGSDGQKRAVVLTSPRARGSAHSERKGGESIPDDDNSQAAAGAQDIVRRHVLAPLTAVHAWANNRDVDIGSVEYFVEKCKREHDVVVDANARYRKSLDLRKTFSNIDVQRRIAFQVIDAEHADSDGKHATLKELVTTLVKEPREDVDGETAVGHVVKNYFVLAESDSSVRTDTDVLMYRLLLCASDELCRDQLSDHFVPAFVQHVINDGAGVWTAILSRFVTGDMELDRIEFLPKVEGLVKPGQDSYCAMRWLIAKDIVDWNSMVWDVFKPLLLDKTLLPQVGVAASSMTMSALRVKVVDIEDVQHHTTRADCLIADAVVDEYNVISRDRSAWELKKEELHDLETLRFQAMVRRGEQHKTDAEPKMEGYGQAVFNNASKKANEYVKKEATFAQKEAKAAKTAAKAADAGHGNKEGGAAAGAGGREPTRRDRTSTVDKLRRGVLTGINDGSIQDGTAPAGQGLHNGLCVKTYGTASGGTVGPIFRLTISTESAQRPDYTRYVGLVDESLPLGLDGREMMVPSNMGETKPSDVSYEKAGSQLAQLICYMMSSARMMQLALPPDEIKVGGRTLCGANGGADAEVRFWFLTVEPYGYRVTGCGKVVLDGSKEAYQEARKLDTLLDNTVRRVEALLQNTALPQVLQITHRGAYRPWAAAASRAATP